MIAIAKKSKNNKPTLRFVGMNAEDVTGSAQIISYRNKNVMLDFGMYQCANKLKMYQVNSRNLEFSVKSITEIVISHALHLDHYCMIPRLFKLGCEAKIYVPKDTIVFWKTLFKDNLKIMEKDLEYLKKAYKKSYEPLYTEVDVDNMMENVIECEFDEKIKINKYMEIRYRDAYHILNSGQIELFIRDENLRKKVLYTGDIGNTCIPDKPFLRPFFPIENADIVIGESTYAMKIKPANQKTKDKDIEKLETTIREVCLEKKRGNVIFSSFATQRTQELLVELYNLFGEDENFHVPIVIDSPLACSVIRLFKEVLDGEDKELMERILAWKNLSLISEWKDSETVLYDKTPKVIIACSGFMEAGRIRNYLKVNLPNPDSTLVTIGYSSPESLASLIKSDKKKTIKIDDEEVLNKAKIVSLNSFTSHMQHESLLDYYSNINCNSIFLVHGELTNRCMFANLLEEKCRNKCKTTKIFIGTRGTDFKF